MFAQEFYGNALWVWSLAVGIAVGVAVLLWVARKIGARALAREREDAGFLVRILQELVGRTKLWFIVVVGIYAGALALSLPDTLHRAVGLVVMLGFLLQLAFWGSGLIAFWLTRYTKRMMQEDAAAATTVRALGFLGNIALWTIVVLMALDQMGIKVTSLIAGLGIGGIAVALAVQNVLRDLFASLSIVLDKPFVIGDFIIVGDLMGTVEHIGLKTTRVRSLSGEQLVFSNNDLLNSRVRNFKRMQRRRMTFSIGVTYQTPYELVERIPAIIREAIEAQDLAEFDRAHFWEYGDYALKFEAVYFVSVPDFNVGRNIQQAINLFLYSRFQEEGIEFAYPTQTIFLERPAGE